MLVIGARGFAKELLTAILETTPETVLAFFDNVNVDAPSFLFGKFPVLKSETEVLEHWRRNGNRFALGVGNPQARRKLAQKFASLGGELTSVISANARIGVFDNEIGVGVNVLANAVIEASNFIGRGCLIHTGSLISHDTTIGKFCEISPAAQILGEAKIGDLCSLGTGCVILPKIKIGDNVVVGAGAVVTKDVPDKTTVAGVPARLLQK